MRPERIAPWTALAALPLLAGLMPSPQAPAPLAPERDIATLVPERALLYVEAPGLPELLRAGRAHPLVHALADSILGKSLLDKFAAEQAEPLRLAEQILGGAVADEISVLARRGLALAVAPRGAGSKGGPAFVLVAHGSDADKVARARGRLLSELGRRFGVEKALERPHEHVAGADLWHLGDDFTLAERGALLVGGNDEDLLRDVLALAARVDGRGILERKDFEAARAARPAQDLVWAWLDLAHVEDFAKQRGGARKGEGLSGLRAASRDPKAMMLLGPGLASIGTAGELVFEARARGARLELELHAVGTEAPGALLPRDGTSATIPPPSVLAGGCASALLYRDWTSVYAGRAELFDSEHLPELAKGASDLSLLFGGKDFADDVLPRVSPWWRVCIRPLSYSPGSEPGIPLPGAALVLELVDPESDGALYLSAFQNTISLTNVDRAQKGGESMVLSLGMEGPTPVTSARFPAPRKGQPVDLRYNFAPACAQLGSHLILATHESLVREMVRELGSPATQAPGAPVSGLTDRLELSGPALADYVERNLEPLVLNAILNEGKEQGQAREEIQGLALALRLIERAVLEVRTQSASTTIAAELDFGAPGPETK